MVAMLYPRHQSIVLDTYFRDVRETSILSPEEEHETCLRIQEGDVEARDLLIRANLRLVVSIARTYQRHDIEFADLVAEGNIGLIRAAEAFDPEMNTRFSTYARLWIKQSILRMIANTSRPIRLPKYMHTLMGKWNRAKTQLLEETGQTPTFDEIARRLKLSPRKLKLVQKAIRIYNAAPNTGLHEEGTDIEETLPDAAFIAPIQALGEREDAAQVLQLLDTLEPRQSEVLRLRFGLDGDAPLKLNEIGARLNVTRERVRQIEKEALRRLAVLMDM